MDAFETAALFHALTGREPNAADGPLIEDGAQALYPMLRRDMLRSEAFLQARGQRSNTAEGVFYGTGEPGCARIGVISNCQGPELARWLTLSTGASTIGVEVMLYDASRREQFMKPFKRCNWILAAPFNAKRFHGLKADELQMEFPGRVIAIPSINFSGLLPDIVQLGAMDARIDSPIGSHSRLIVAGFLQGLSVEQTLASFREESFATLGFYDRFAAAEEEMRERERACDIRIADELIALCRTQPTMFTENHPDGPVYLAVARQAAKLMGLPFTSPPAAMLPPIHAMTTAWPIYDEIAEHHRLPYRMTQLYSTLDEMLTRRQFIESCFTIYKNVDRPALAAAAKDRGIPC